MTTKMEILTSSFWNGWQTLPDFIFSDIMMMLGLESLQDLIKCRQVCQGWKGMLSKMTKLKKKTIMKTHKSVAADIRKKCWTHYYTLDPSKIVTAASLAHHGILESVKKMEFFEVDLASVPAEHLASLASCVMVHVVIGKVRNCDIISILDNLKCVRLSIHSQSLSIEETLALVRAMESGVEKVFLNWMGLDTRALTQYSGQGKCRWLDCYNDTAHRCREVLRSWASRVNWCITSDLERHISVCPPWEEKT